MWRTALSLLAARRISTVSAPPGVLPPSVHSKGTIASAPPGSRPPVMILMQRPGIRVLAVVSPAVTSPLTGSVTGLSSLAVATSAASTA